VNHKRINALLFGVGVIVGAAATVLLAARSDHGGVDLQGTARMAAHPEANVVVWLDAPGAPRSAAPAKRVVLDQRNLSFSPVVLVVRVGTTVELPNNDRVFHNVFSFHNGKRFDLGLYPVGTVRHVTFDQPGLSRIFCNIHANMAAYVMAVDTPYYAISDRDGRFELPSVETGHYTYHAWRSGGSDLTGTVDVQPGQSLDLDWP
jgi:plastocyanin